MTSIGWRIAQGAGDPGDRGLVDRADPDRRLHQHLHPARGERRAHPLGAPRSPTLQAYHDLLGGTSSQRAGGTVTEAGTFTRSIYNSAILSAVSTVFVLVFSTMAAYAFGRLRFRFGGAVLAILVGTMIVPIFVVVISLFNVLPPPIGPA